MSLSEPVSSSVTVMLSVEGSDAVPVGSSSANLQSKLPSPVALLKVIGPTNVPEAPQSGVPAVNVSGVPGSVVSKL